MFKVVFMSGLFLGVLYIVYVLIIVYLKLDWVLFVDLDVSDVDIMLFWLVLI